MGLLTRLRKNQKGFTLVEILVVLVIMAIIAAATVPTMTGFVKDARKKAHLAEARTVYVAAQAAAAELKGMEDGSIDEADLKERIDELLDGELQGSYEVSIDGDDLDYIEYQADDGSRVTISVSEGVSYD